MEYQIHTKRVAKVAVSIPDDLHRRVERFVRRAKRSRSGLYAEALAEYLARRSEDEVTEAINRALEQIPEEQQEEEAEAGTRWAAQMWAKDAPWND
jgi:metal-responsive CopG/Arc/MetJ family transcriptional regulator